MTISDELGLTHYSVHSRLAVWRQFAILLTILSILLYSNDSKAQGLYLNLTGELVPPLNPASGSITALQAEHGAYDQRQVELLEDLGRFNQEQGEYQQALALFKQALHVTRVNEGLYHASQIPIIDQIISTEIALKNWKAVDDFYAYQEHLYCRLYDTDDTRLEEGLRKVSAWHITALNVNLDGNRIAHLRKANKLFKLRLRVAENTLSLDDPKFAMLARNIEIFERELFLSSDLNRELLVRQPRSSQSRRSSIRQSESRLVVTAD